MGTGSAFAQTDYSGTYYIASDYQNPSNKVRQYDPNTLENNYYLCPSDGWIYYKPENDWSADGTAYPNYTGGADQTKDLTITVEGSNIIDNIYGGGNNAAVTGQTLITVGLTQ